MEAQTLTNANVPVSRQYLAAFLAALLFLFLLSMLSGCYASAKDKGKKSAPVVAMASVATPVAGAATATL